MINLLKLSLFINAVLLVALAYTFEVLMKVL